MLDEVLSNKIKEHSFYKHWVKDMANISQIFCDMMEDTSIKISLESSRTCKRYHIDNVPIRLLVTYYGKGTEWIPNHACDYSAYYNGENNNKVIKDNAEKKFIEDWDIAVFKGQRYKGGEKAILHRTPDSALGKLSLLMRLDNKACLSDNFKY